MTRVGHAILPSFVGSACSPKSDDATLDLIRGRLDADAIAEAWREGETLTYDEAVALALDELDAQS